jgi:hypothetical protein
MSRSELPLVREADIQLADEVGCSDWPHGVEFFKFRKHHSVGASEWKQGKKFTARCAALIKFGVAIS